MPITNARISDAERLTDLTIRSKAYWGYGTEQIEEWRNELTITEEYISDNQVFNLVLDDALIGFYAYDIENKTDIKLNFLFIDPKHIGKGHGKTLLADFLKRVANSGYGRVVLDADPNAEKFYGKLGFQIVGKLKSTIKNRYLPVMALEITPTTKI